MTLRPWPLKPDWFVTDTETVEPIASSPGIKANGTRWLVHRSQLPLLPDYVGLPGNDLRVWETRDAWMNLKGIKLRTTQHQAIDFIRGRRGVLLADEMRLGKGHPVGTLILTPTGWVPIELLRVGDRVVGLDGRPCMITGTYQRGVLPVFRVEFSDGAAVRVDGDHLWSTWGHNDFHRGKPPRTMETRALIDDLHDGAGNRKWRIPMVRPVEFSRRDLSLDPYVLGVLLGDGALSTTVSFTPGDDAVPREVEQLLPLGASLMRHASKDRAVTWAIVGDRHHDNPVLDALRSLGLMGLKSPDKFVPDVYLYASIEQRLALLQGLMDTDGELFGNVVSFSSSSQALAEAVAFLVESLGGNARRGLRSEPKYMYRGEQRVGLPSYRLTIAMPAEFSPFRTRSGYIPRQKFQPSRLIESIEPDGEAEVICIAVDAVDQLYVTEQFIVTHNTLACVASHDPKDGPFVVIAPLSTRAVWLGWIKRVFPEHADNIGVLIGKKFDPEKIRGKAFVFGHYDILPHWQTLMEIGTLVFDEAHALIKHDNKRTIAAMTISARAKRVICATGTPIWNMPIGMWSILSILAPGSFGSYFDFGDRYCNPTYTAYGRKYDGAGNQDELGRRLYEVMIRRKWIDVAKDLPTITRNVVVAEVSPTERKKLDIAAAELASDRTNTAGNLARYRRQLCQFKLVTACREAQQIVARGESVVLWTWHVDFAVELAKKLGTEYVIHGDVSPAKREAILDRWRADPMPRVLVANMAVAQVGIDLSRARFAVFAEIDWTPAIIGQAEMRTFEATRPMSVTYIVADHIIEQRLVAALIRKLGAADPIGVAAAVDAIDALRSTFLGPQEVADMDRLLEGLLDAA